MKEEKNTLLITIMRMVKKRNHGEFMTVTEKKRTDEDRQHYNHKNGNALAKNLFSLIKIFLWNLNACNE